MLLFIVKLSTSKCFFALVTHTQLTFCFLAFEREGKTYRYMKSAPFVYQSPSQGPIAFSSSHGILVPSSHFLPLNASLRAHCILAYQLNSRASFAFSCSHCIHACPLYSHAPITFLCNHCIPVRPLHSGVPFTSLYTYCFFVRNAFSYTHYILVHPLHSGVPIPLLYLYRILVLSLHRLYNNCIPVRLLHSHTPIAFSCTHCIPLRVNFFTFSSNTCHSHYS